MIRIRKIYDDTSAANRDAIAQAQVILRKQFPRARPVDLEKLPKQLHDPVQYRYRSILFVAESVTGKVKGFAVMLHMPDLGIAYLELISAAPGRTGGGIGSVLYEWLREEARSLGVQGLFFECSVDDPAFVTDPVLLKQNITRLRFYERYGARPIMNNDYACPVHPGDEDLYYLMYDTLGSEAPLRLKNMRKIVRGILDRKYGDLLDPAQIEAVTLSFKDDPIALRPPKYKQHTTAQSPREKSTGKGIALIVNEAHSIHHVRDRGYVEAPVRIPVIMQELEKTQLFTHVKPRKTPLRLIKQVHDADFIDYLHRACERLPLGKSIYPIIFPTRNITRPPEDIELEVGYYCMDTFTPLNSNAYLAAHGAVDCAVTGAASLLEGYRLAYALVRPPGHHAERRAFGGFCYFNSAAVAAEYLSAYGRIAILDVDFHHGNGTQDIFYTRADVLTLSIHGDPRFAYPHFAGFKDEHGEGAGEGFNINFPLPESITVEQYQQTLAKALKHIRTYRPAYLIISLGLDTAKADPTGSWTLRANDFAVNGRMIGALGLPTLIVQEGGYRTRTLGINARHFFEGLWAGHKEATAT